MSKISLEMISKPEHVLAFVNPVAGVGDGRGVMQRLSRIDTPRVTVQVTTPDLDYAAAIRTGIANGVDRILVAGGDGTLMASVSGAVLTLGSSLIPVSWVPVGTGNVVAGSLNIPRKIDVALRLALGPGLVRFVDLAQVGNRCSLLRISAGFEAVIAHQVTRQDLNHLGLLAYGVSGLTALRSTMPVEYQVVIDDQRPVHIVGITAFVTSTGSLTWMRRLAGISPTVQPDDGHFYAGIARALSPGRIAATILHLLEGRGLSPESIALFRAHERVELDTEVPQPTQIDGDPWGTTPIVATLLPKALPFVVHSISEPAPTALFGRRSWWSRNIAKKVEQGTILQTGGD